MVGGTETQAGRRNQNPEESQASGIRCLQHDASETKPYPKVGLPKPSAQVSNEEGLRQSSKSGRLQSRRVRRNRGPGPSRAASGPSSRSHHDAPDVVRSQ